MSRLTFEELRIRSNDHMEDRSDALQEAESEGNARRIRAVRGQIQNTLDRRAEIEDLASTQGQRETYGAEKWHADFVMLRELPSEERTKAWNALPNSRFKRFQELFSQPHQYCIPRGMIGANGSIVAPLKSQLDTMACRHVW